MNRGVVLVMRYGDVAEQEYMKAALKEAQKAFREQEIPIGAVIVYHDRIIAKAHNRREQKQDGTAHAEILAIRQACKKLGSWRLEDCELYVTLEPCAMCAGAIIQSRIRKVYYGARNDRYGCHQGVIRLFDVPFNHRVQVQNGLMEEECSTLISSFFEQLRS